MHAGESRSADGGVTGASDWRCSRRNAVDAGLPMLLTDEKSRVEPVQRLAKPSSGAIAPRASPIPLSLPQFDGNRRAFPADEAGCRLRCIGGSDQIAMFPGPVCRRCGGGRDRRHGATRRREGADFTLRSFHDRLLSYAALPPALTPRDAAGTSRSLVLDS